MANEPTPSRTAAECANVTAWPAPWGAVRTHIQALENQVLALRQQLAVRHREDQKWIAKVVSNADAHARHEERKRYVEYQEKLDAIRRQLYHAKAARFVAGKRIDPPTSLDPLPPRETPLRLFAERMAKCPVCHQIHECVSPCSPNYGVRLARTALREYHDAPR